MYEIVMVPAMEKNALFFYFPISHYIQVQIQSRLNLPLHK